MAGELQANRSYQAGEPGYYAINPRTKIAVAGPFTAPNPAYVEIRERNRKWPMPNDDLAVVYVEPETVAPATTQRPEEGP